MKWTLRVVLSLLSLYRPAIGAPPRAVAGASATAADARSDAMARLHTAEARLKEVSDKILRRLEAADKEAFLNEQREWGKEKEATIMKKVKEAPAASGKAVYWQGEAAAAEARLAELERRLTALPPLETPAGAAPKPTPAEVAAAELDPADVTGVYVGEASARQSLYKVEWQLTRGSSRTSMKAEAITYLPGGTVEQALGNARYSGMYDEASHKIRLVTLEGQTGSSPISFEGLEFKFDPASGSIQGSLPNGSGVVKANRDVARSRARQATLAAQAKQLAAAQSSFWQARDQNERSLILRRWLDRMVTEYPEVDAGHLTNVDDKAINLFMDDLFVPVFEKPLEQFSKADLEKCFRLIAECGNNPLYRERFSGWRWTQLVHAFSPSGMRNKIIAGVAFRRTKVAAMKEVLAQLASVLSTQAGFGQAETLRASINDVPREESDVFWPSQRKAVDEAALAARRRTADGALAEAAAAALGGAKGYETALACRDFQQTHAAIVSLAAPAAREKETERVQAHLHETLAALMAAPRQELNALGSGVEAVTAGARWYRSFEERFASKFKDSSLDDTLAVLLRRRPADLAAGEADLLSRIQKADQEARITGLLAESLGVPGDDRIDAAIHLRAAAAERIAAVRWEQEKTKYSERELALMSKPGTLKVPAHYPPPTEQEIGLAILRAAASVNGEVISADTATYRPISIIQGFVYKITVRKVTLGSTATSASGGYDCACSLLWKLDMPGAHGELGTSGVAVNMMRELQRKLDTAEAQPIDLRLVLTTTGWQSPTMQEVFRANSFDFLFKR